MGDTRAVWGPIHGHDLNDSDVIEILTNVRRLLDVLRPPVPPINEERSYEKAQSE